MHGRVYNDVCAFVANSEAVAMSLEAQQAKVPSLGALHNIARYGLNVGVMVRGYYGDTTSANPYYKIIPLKSDGRGRSE